MSTNSASAGDPHAPLLHSRHHDLPNPSSSSSSSSSSISPPPTPTTGRATSLAVLLGRASGRRSPSLLVRESAARELEERRVDWGYSKPVVAVDLVWNITFVLVSLTMLIVTSRERPNTPIRIWICGYALQCLIHVVLVWMEFRRRNRSRDGDRRRRRDEEEVDGGRISDEDDDGNDRSSFNAGSVLRFFDCLVSALLWC